MACCRAEPLHGIPGDGGGREGGGGNGGGDGMATVAVRALADLEAIRRVPLRTYSQPLVQGLLPQFSQIWDV